MPLDPEHHVSWSLLPFGASSRAGCVAGRARWKVEKRSPGKAWLPGAGGSQVALRADAGAGIAPGVLRPVCSPLVPKLLGTRMVYVCTHEQRSSFLASLRCRHGRSVSSLDRTYTGLGATLQRQDDNRRDLRVSNEKAFLSGPGVFSTSSHSHSPHGGHRCACTRVCAGEKKGENRSC